MDGSLSTIVAAYSRPVLVQIVVAIPVRNEARRLPRLLRALSTAAMRSPLPVTAVVLANNCTDGSARIVRSFTHPSLRLELHQVDFPDPNAGIARRVVLDLAARPGALILTTDGDAAPHADWIAAALRAADAGADLVCGRIDADCRHVLATAPGRRVTQAEAAHGALQHEIRHAVDLLAGRQGSERPHYIESAASMAIRSDGFRLIGGLPDTRSSEDRALVHQAESHGLAIRYADDMLATVSGRLHGRAEGGMAEALRQRMSDDDPLADQAMLPVPVLADLWSRATAGDSRPWPSRALSLGNRLRASDLEAELPALRRLVEGSVRPRLLPREKSAA